MDRQDNRVTLYCSQSDEVVGNLRRDGVHHAKIAFIRKKYEETADTYLFAYNWYAANAARIVPRPEEAESGIWAHADPMFFERHKGYAILKLDVPLERAVFFRMSDWNKILNFRYVGTPEEERAFAEKLQKHGVGYEGDVVMKPFYPQLKGELLRSWDALFRFDAKIKSGESAEIPDIQIGLWELRSEWVREWDC